MSYAPLTSLAALCLLICAGVALPARSECSLSTSRQFLVHGPDVRMRAAICDLAETAKKDVLQITGQRDEWNVPIVICAQYPRTNLPELPPAAFSIAQTGFGLRLQLDLVIDRDTSLRKIRLELLRVILIEMIYRQKSHLPAGAGYAVAPGWLVEGISSQQEDFDWREWFNRHRTGAKPGRFLSLAELLQSWNPATLDAPSRMFYQVHSRALVDLLVHSRDGRERLNCFIRDLGSAAMGPIANLGTHFPELSDPVRAEAAWSSHLVRHSTGHSFAPLGAPETAEQLVTLLSLRIPEGNREAKCSLEQFPRFIRKRSASRILDRASRKLSILAARGHPAYRSIIGEYARIGSLLARRRTNGVRNRLIRLNGARKSIATRVGKIEDYINWIEATQLTSPSEEFGDYMTAAEETGRPEKKKGDCISVYLDGLETQYPAVGELF